MPHDKLTPLPDDEREVTGSRTNEKVLVITLGTARVGSGWSPQSTATWIRVG